MMLQSVPLRALLPVPISKFSRPFHSQSDRRARCGSRDTAKSASKSRRQQSQQHTVSDLRQQRKQVLVIHRLSAWPAIITRLTRPSTLCAGAPPRASRTEQRSCRAPPACISSAGLRCRGCSAAAAEPASSGGCAARRASKCAIAADVGHPRIQRPGVDRCHGARVALRRCVRFVQI